MTCQQSLDESRVAHKRPNMAHLKFLPSLRHLRLSNFKSKTTLASWNRVDGVAMVRKFAPDAGCKLTRPSELQHQG
jgi:hypothetical protein